MKQPKSLVKQMTPEEIELEKKRAELSILEDELTIKELDLTTLQVALEDLRRRYLRIVGVKLAKLDDIEAQIAEILARLEPENEEVRKEAERSRTQAQESANTTESIATEEYETEPFKPSEDLKQLYRDLAKKVHPDLAPDEQARERRHRFMQEINKAYAERNEERLRSLLNEWESSPDSVSGEGTGAELIRIIRQLALVRARIEAIGKEMETLKETELYSLKLRVDEAQDAGRELLSEMAHEVDAQIVGADARLREMIKRVEKDEQRKTKQNDSKKGIH
ncbi:MAG: J domain-containing protein [Deltaproteobacteria bacterium]|nr:J domain-containing protein [Deltaproteobacteria bacterium]